MDIFALGFLEASVVALWTLGLLATLVLFLRDRCLRMALALALALVIPLFGISYAALRLIRSALSRKTELKS